VASTCIDAGSWTRLRIARELLSLPLQLMVVHRSGAFGTTFVPQATTTLSNPLGCWDWWGYDDPSYATKNGRQMAAVREMMGRIASGAK
jgi:hypothetical protein